MRNPLPQCLFTLLLSFEYYGETMACSGTNAFVDVCGNFQYNVNKFWLDSVFCSKLNVDITDSNFQSSIKL